MQAYSSTTDQTYPSWDDLLAVEANGFAVVVIMRTSTLKTGKSRTFARVTGPFADRPAARTEAARKRRKFARVREDYPGTELVAVCVEPLWKSLEP